MQHIITSLLGGALLGLSATLLLWGLGASEGVSGVYGGLLTRRGPGFRLTFLLGLLAAGLVVHWVWPASFGAPVQTSVFLVVVAGFLVGLGTRMGSGCTSGHGITGLSRLSVRSLVATLTFIASGALAVVVLRALGESS